MLLRTYERALPCSPEMPSLCTRTVTTETSGAECERLFSTWHLVGVEVASKCSHYGRFGKEDAEQLYQVIGRTVIKIINDQTFIESLTRDRVRRRDHGGEHGRLSRYKTAVYTEGCSLRFNDNIPIFEPDL